MRKLVLVKVTYDLGNDTTGEQTHLVVLNVNKVDHFTANQEMEMAVTKAKLYYEKEMPHAKIISIVPSVTISSDNVPQKEHEATSTAKVWAEKGWNAAYDFVIFNQTFGSIGKNPNKNKTEFLDSVGDLPTEEGLTIELPVFNFHPMSEIPEMNPNEIDTSFDVLIDLDGWRKYFYIGCYHTDFKEWRLKKEDTDDYEIDFKKGRWTYLPHAARDKK